MGWTTINATYYKNNGTIDRLKEIKYMWEGGNHGKTHVLKMSIFGTVVYGAIQVVATGEVFGLVALTSIDGKEFSYKDMDDTCGPNYWDCPLSILKLLTPTNNENANEWRKRCYLQAKVKKQKAKLSAMPVGTVIEFINEYDMIAADGSYGRKKGDTVRLVKKQLSFLKDVWCDSENGRWFKWRVKMIPANYRVIS